MGAPLFENQGSRPFQRYMDPYFVEYRHVIYHWKALELIVKVLKGGGVPLLENLRYLLTKYSETYFWICVEMFIDGSFPLSKSLSW